MVKNSGKLIAILILLTTLVSFTHASYSLKITVKFPFITTHLDSLGNEISDSLVRYREIQVTIYRTDFLDSLLQEYITNNTGETFFSFDYRKVGSNLNIITIIDIQEQISKIVLWPGL